MIRTISTLVILGIVAAVPQAAIAKKAKTQTGVFGTINGKSLKATNREGAGDHCVFGIYKPTDNILTFSAIECKPKRRRQGATKKNYKILLVSCLASDAASPPLTPPFDLVCPFSAYTETKTGRFGALVSMDEWGADLTYDTTDFTTHSQVNARIDSFDGANISGVITGVFTQPLAGNATPPAAISGEVRFSFPIQVQ
jgi:hypothetical protein